jgi:hypothetical protein
MQCSDWNILYGENFLVGEKTATMVGYQPSALRFQRIMKVENIAFTLTRWFFSSLKIIISQKVIVLILLFFPNHLVLKVENYNILSFS